MAWLHISLCRAEDGIRPGRPLGFGDYRTSELARSDAESLRLAYAQHVYRQQGATVDRSVVLTGGWQTSRETAYVQATRAHHGTDWYLARDQLGIEGQDPDRIERFARQIGNGRLRTTSVAYDELRDTAWRPTRDPLQLSRSVVLLRRLMTLPERDHDGGLER